MRKSIILIGILVASHTLLGQHWFGMNQSNYNGSNAFYMNTAQAASQPHVVASNGFATGFHFENNYLTYEVPFTFTQWMTGNVPTAYKNSQGRIDFKNEWFVENLDGKDKSVDLYAESRGPAVMYNFNRTFAAGFFSSTRIGLQAHQINQDVARVLRHGLDSSNNIIYDPPSQIKVGQTYGDNSFTANMSAYSEIGIGAAVALIQNYHMKLSVGGNVKYLMGKGAAYIKNNGVQFEVAGNDSIVFGQTDIEYAYVQPQYFTDLSMINFFNGTNAGTGFGFDLSANLELRRPLGRVGSRVEIPDVVYYFRGGISLLDVGGITYNKDVVHKQFVNSTPTSWVPGEAFATAWYGGFESGMAYTDSLVNSLFQVGGETTIRTTLPTTLAVHGDIRIIPKLFVGFQVFQSLKSKDSEGLRRPSATTIIPRFEAKAFEVSVPMSLYNDYQNATLGLFLRFGPFFVGSDNIVSSVNTTSFNGLNYYMGLSQGFGNSGKSKF